MNLQRIVVLCIVVVALVGAWYFFMSDPKEAHAPATTDSVETVGENDDQTTETQKSNDALSGFGSFANIMGLGRNLTCDFTHVAEETGGAVAGTVYISGERLRGDFEMEQAGMVYKSHMIHDDETIYTWTESDQGMVAMKFPNTDDDGGLIDDGQADDRSMSLDEAVEYDCRPWSVNASAFVPPSDIEFMDFESFMEEAMQGFDAGSLDYQLSPQ